MICDIKIKSTVGIEIISNHFSVIIFVSLKKSKKVSAKESKSIL